MPHGTAIHVWLAWWHCHTHLMSSLLVRRPGTCKPLLPRHPGLPPIVSKHQVVPWEHPESLWFLQPAVCRSEHYFICSLMGRKTLANYHCSQLFPVSSFWTKNTEKTEYTWGEEKARCLSPSRSARSSLCRRELLTNKLVLWKKNAAAFCEAASLINTQPWLSLLSSGFQMRAAGVIRALGSTVSEIITGWDASLLYSVY